MPARTVQQRPREGGDRRFAILATASLVGLAGVVAALVVLTAGGRSSTAGTSGPQSVHVLSTPQPADATLRTVIVSHAGTDIAVDAAAPLQAHLVSGVIPAAREVATVLTDENCNPDAQGVNHCLNNLRRPDGSTLRVQNNHMMDSVPCLAVGERVNVEPAQS